MDGDEIPEEEFRAVSLLLEHARSEEIDKRLQACKQLERIARALGAERTREELIPFMEQGADDEEEILVAIAEQIAKLAAFLAPHGGAEGLLLPLESFAQIEEGGVRAAVVAAVAAVAETFDVAKTREHLYPMVTRLGAKEWLPCRLTASCLLPIGCAELTPAQRAEYLGLFLSLCGDDAVMVRRMAASNFGSFVRAAAAAAAPGSAELSELKAKVLPQFKALGGDEMDSVRIHICEAAVSLAEGLDRAAVVEQVLPVAVQLSREGKWRVRWSTAVHLPALCAAVGPDTADNTLVPAGTALLNDPEAEVRAAAVANAGALLKTLGRAAAAEAVLPNLLGLAEDPSTHVRLALGTCLSGLAPALGASATAEHLLPVLLALLRDEETDVRLAVLGSLEPLQEVLGVRLLGDSILPSVLGLTTDAKWRVRLAVVSALPLLARQLASDKFTPEILDICMKMLVDPVFSIRKATVDLLAEIIGVCTTSGSTTAAAWVLDRLKQMAEEPAYEPRLTAAMALEALCKPNPKVDEVDPVDLRTDAVPPLLKLARDPIPNVRIAVARALGYVFGAGVGRGLGLDGGLKNSQESDDGMEDIDDMEGIQDCLGRLASDGDPDVVYFAKKALNTKEAGEA